MTETGSLGRGDGQALSGVTVVDLTHFEAGSVATQILAWLGAEVVKVEPVGPYPGRDNPVFHLVQCNKASITLDLKHPEGHALMCRLLEAADVFVENLGPGAMQRLNLDHASVEAINPRLVYARVKGFGPGSPFEHFPAYDPVAQATGGSMSLTGDADGPPMRAGVNLGDSGAGLHAVIGVLAALAQRHRTGRGQLVEIAMQDAVIGLSRTAYVQQYRAGEAAPRVGNSGYPGYEVAPSNAFPCAPGGSNDWCFVHCHTDAEWDRMLEVLDRADLRGDPDLQTSAARHAHRDRVDEIVGAWTSRHGKHEVMRRLGEARIAAGAVLSTEDLAADEHLRRRGVFVTVEHPVLGETVVPGWPLTMSASPVRVEPPPALGEHTDEVLGRLACSDDEIERLRANGVI